MFKVFVVSRAGKVTRVEFADLAFRLNAPRAGERVEYMGLYAAFAVPMVAKLFLEVV